jgi:hypothetical protein
MAGMSSSMRRPPRSGFGGLGCASRVRPRAATDLSRADNFCDNAVIWRGVYDRRGRNPCR